jgi:hypothetical protein
MWGSMVVFQHQKESMSKSVWETLLDSLLADPLFFLEVDKDGFCFLCDNKLIYGTHLSSLGFLPCFVWFQSLVYCTWIVNGVADMA